MVPAFPLAFHIEETIGRSDVGSYPSVTVFNTITLNSNPPMPCLRLLNRITNEDTRAELHICWLTMAPFASGQSSYNSPTPARKFWELYFSTDIDNVDINNGNLHINIPLFDLPGREIPLHFAWITTASFWNPARL